MTRPVRIPSPTGFFHVTSRALQPLRLFADRSDCLSFLHGLARTHTEDSLEIHAYCLMGTHFHLVVRAEPDVLRRSMKCLKGWYALGLNARCGRVGPVFDGRYRAFPVKTEAHAAAAIVYLALNPVRAGITRHPDEWPYSSHRAHAGLEARPHWLASLDRLALFASAASYRDAIDAAVQQIRNEERVRTSPDPYLEQARREL